MQKSWIRPLSFTLSFALLLIAAGAHAESSYEYFESARAYAHKGNYTRAQSMFIEIAQEDPNLPEAAWNAAFLADKTANYETCALYYRHFLFLVPKPSDREETISALQSCERHIPQSGKVDIYSSTDDATITVDGVPIAKNQISSLILRSGRHTVEISAPDHDSIKQEITVVADVKTFVSETLKESVYRGTLNMTVDHDGAVVRFNGKTIGTTPLPQDGVEVSANKELLLSVEKDGYLPWQRYITVPANLSYDLDVRLLRDHSQD